MSDLQVHAFDIPTPFAILGDISINPDLESRSPPKKISSKYSLYDSDDDLDPTTNFVSTEYDPDYKVEYDLPTQSSSPRDDESTDDELECEIDSSLKQQVEYIYQLMQQPDPLEKAMSLRPQQVEIEEESLSDSDEEMEHPLDYLPEFKCNPYESDSDDDLILPTEIIKNIKKKNQLRIKPQSPIAKHQPSRKYQFDSKFRNQLQELKQNSEVPGHYHTMSNVHYYVATPQKTSKTCSICKQQSNSTHKMQAVTWWGDKRKYFDIIDQVAPVDACSSCFDNWVGHHIEDAKSGFLEPTNSGQLYTLRPPQVKDFFSGFKPQSLYVKVRF